MICYSDSMKTVKRVIDVFPSRPTTEGAGVRLHRGFANREIPRFDPFLLFDDFSGKNPADYLAGFPWHPHRGIETVTYLLDGNVRHRDSLNNAGVIKKNEVQWMTAGSGIIHEEMPEGMGGILGFQLWVNLPQKNKMMNPRYQDISANEIPEITVGPHASVRVIAGSMGSVAGPVKDIIADPLYIDVMLQKEKEVVIPLREGYTTFLYVFNGSIGMDHDGSALYAKGNIILLSSSGEELFVRAGSVDARFLVVSGKPQHEPIAWHGPIVMNTQEELKTAFQELEDGRFIK